MIAELHIILCRWRALYNIIYYYNDYLFEIVEATLLCNFAILRERGEKTIFFLRKNLQNTICSSYICIVIQK